MIAVVFLFGIEIGLVIAVIVIVLTSHNDFWHK